MKKILLYSDSKQTGGHEVLSVEIAKALSMEFDVYYIVSSFNADLVHRLNELRNIDVIEFHYASNRFQIIRNLLSFSSRFKLFDLVSRIKPDICIALQGTIDSSFLVIPLCARLHIPTVSYIPIAFNLRDVTKYKSVGYLKDLLQLYYYKKPNYFITINQFLADNIKNKCRGRNVFIVKNGVDFSRYKNLDKEECRNKYGIRTDSYVMAYIGRIELWHKGLDYYVDFISNNAHKLKDVVFLFVGNGNANSVIDSLVKQFANVIHIPWTSSVSEIYSLIDCFILPSRFESGPGCPITLLEALYYNIPVIASNIPEVAVTIPSEQLFEIGNSEQIMDRIIKVKKQIIKPIAFDESQFSLKAFRESFLQCIKCIMSLSK